MLFIYQEHRKKNRKIRSLKVYSNLNAGFISFKITISQHEFRSSVRMSIELF